VSKYISYVRLGKRLDRATQEAAVRRYAELNPGKIVASFVETKGKEEGWPALHKAIEAALEHGAVLVIADIGRLSRSVAFTLALQQSQVNFACCDMPNANERTIHILANLAQDESQQARQRTRDAMAALKAKGVKLGSQRDGHWKGREDKRGWRQAVAGSIAKRKQRAAEAYQFLLPEIKARRERGETMAQIAEWLNETNHLTTAGKPFTDVAVWRIVNRYLGKEFLGNNAHKTKATA